MSVWGHLADRYETPRPRKLLTLDGGGMRGLITLEILAEIETQLRARTESGDDFRLCDFFDYIGGTSTGAIIAAGLSRGMSCEELLEFYRSTGANMFEEARLRERFRHLYSADPLVKQLKSALGEKTTLRPEFLRCLLLVVTRNASTDSPWPISSNPLAKYNDTARPDCNLNIPLWQLIRASTGAPVYFPPEVMQWDPNDESKSFVFVDGGVTPYNNPGFLLFRMATSSEYGLNWKTGERDLMLVSVGTGAAPSADDPTGLISGSIPANLVKIPKALLYAASVDQDINCRTIGRCVHGAPIDREIGDLVPKSPDGKPAPLEEDLGRAFLYARYNADLSREGLEALELDDIQPAEVQKLDSVAAMDDLCRVGAAVARDVNLSAFARFF